MRLPCDVRGIDDAHMHVQLLTRTPCSPRSAIGGRRWVGLLLALLLATPCAASEPLDEGHAALLQTIDHLSGPTHHWHERAARVDRAFDTYLLPQLGVLSERSTQDLRVLLQALHAAAVAVKQPRYSTLALRVGAELRARGALQPADTRVGAIIAMLTRDARALSPTSPWVPAFNGRPLPQLPDTARAFEYWMPGPEAGGIHTATAQMAELDIIVIAHPTCGFTRAAADAANADPELLQMLSGRRTLWLSPQDGTLDTGIFSDWSERHSELPIHIVARQSDFPDIGYWGTPTFYILRDGSVVARVVGWPRGGNKAALQQALGAAGISAVP